MIGEETQDSSDVTARASQPRRPLRGGEAQLKKEEAAPSYADHPNAKSRPTSSGSEVGNLVFISRDVNSTCNLLREQGAEFDDPNQTQADGQHVIWEHGRRRGAREGALACGGSSIFVRRADGRHAARGSGSGGARGSAPPGREAGGG